jgi:hypothetical protein
MLHTTTQPRITAITQTYQFVIKKSTYVIALAVFGGMSILAGVISFVSAIILLSNAAMPSLVNTILTDVAFNFVLGALIIASSRALAQGKMLAVWLYGSSLLIDSFYSLVMGYPLNYIFMGLGLLLIWQMVKYKAELELS